MTFLLRSIKSALPLHLENETHLALVCYFFDVLLDCLITFYLASALILISELANFDRRTHSVV